MMQRLVVWRKACSWLRLNNDWACKEPFPLKYGSDQVSVPIFGRWPRISMCPLRTTLESAEGNHGNSRVSGLKLPMSGFGCHFKPSRLSLTDRGFVPTAEISCVSIVFYRTCIGCTQSIWIDWIIHLSLKAYLWFLYTKGIVCIQS